jgi:predicted RNA-binding protein with EMAP domain
MAIHYYFECKKVGAPLTLLSTLEDLQESSTRKLVDVNDKKNKLLIQYIDCCYIDDDGSVKYDSLKILDHKIQNFRKVQESQIDTLRKFLVEAKALGKDDLVEDIADDIKEVTQCLDQDFSSITNIEDLDGLSLPDLAFNYRTHYINKLYNG